MQSHTESLPDLAQSKLGPAQRFDSLKSDKAFIKSMKSRTHSKNSSNVLQVYSSFRALPRSTVISWTSPILRPAKDHYKTLTTSKDYMQAPVIPIERPTKICTSDEHFEETAEPMLSGIKTVTDACKSPNVMKAKLFATEIRTMHKKRFRSRTSLGIPPVWNLSWLVKDCVASPKREKEEVSKETKYFPKIKNHRFVDVRKTFKTINSGTLISDCKELEQKLLQLKAHARNEIFKVYNKPK